MLEDRFLRTLAAKIEAWAGGEPASRPGGRSPTVVRPLAVAFSGGLDSTVLLAALCRLGLEERLRALHIDHGLNPQSADWEAHCRAVAQSLGTRYSSRRVAVQFSGQGLEADAREARYRALEELLAPDELLLTAHHGDDQLETILLRLLRGSGVRGLRGIHELVRFGRGNLGRPLLGFAKSELERIAAAWELEGLQDPANRDLEHDRNYLRHRVLPSVLERWPAAPRTAQRLALQMADAEDILEAVAADDAETLGSIERIARDELERLSASRQRNLLRHVLRRLDLGTPSAAQLEALQQSLAVSRADAATRVRWPGGEGRVYRDHLYLIRPLVTSSGRGYHARLSRGSEWVGPEGRVAFAPTDGAGVPESWLDGLELRFRTGGEHLHVVGRAHGSSLKHRFQEAGIVPWMRSRIPLLYRGMRLVAVADLWLDVAVLDAPSEARWRVVWTDHPPIR